MRFVGHSLLFALVALVPLTGCKKSDPRVEVSGQVKYKGEPLPAGRVSFVANNVVESGTIKDGRYTIARAPIGAVKISITTPASGGGMQTQQKVEGKSFQGSAGSVSIPEKYSNPDQSGLTHTVTPEKTQTHDINVE